MTAPVSAKPQSEKIAMTAPVTVSKGEEFIVSFVVPREYSLESLPVPDDARVTFEQHPPHTNAVVRYSGSFSQENFEKNLKKLQKWIEENELVPISEPVFAGYNPPFTPAFLRHNEILIKIAD